MGYSTNRESNASCDSFGFDRSLMSALGHAEDDPQRFLRGCMRLATRSYEKVTLWFENNFPFLSVNDRRDAMHEFFMILAHKLGTERSQAHIHDFREDEKSGKLRFRKFLYVVARNAARDFARKQNKVYSRERSLIEDEVATRAHKLIDEIMAEDTDQMMMDIKNRAKITDHDWTIFTVSLRLSAREEVASELEIQSVGAVSAANYRANKKLESISGYIVSAYGHAGSLILSDSKKLCNL